MSLIEGLGFEKALVPSWAPAFSAFGCACSDYAFRYDQQLDFPLSPGGDEATGGYAGMVAGDAVAPSGTARSCQCQLG